MNLIDSLNDRQKEAVVNTDGPMLILAGAGSGKTKVLTTKVAYLIEEKNIDPNNILAITFTNKAAKEMKERIFKLEGNSAFYIQISTFHSFGLKILKENCELLGYEKNFTILDSDDSLSIIKKIMKELNIDANKYNPKAIKNVISNNKNEIIDPEKYSLYVNTDFDEIALEVYRKYEKSLKINNAVDFDDLLILPLKLFNNNPGVLQKYQEKYKYVFIDEYQDTNEPQYILSKIREDKIKIYEYILIKVDLTKSNCFQQKVLRQHYLVIQSETFALYRVFQKQNQIYKINATLLHPFLTS